MAESKNILLRSKKKKAEALLSAQRLPEARAAYEQLCKQNPRDHESWLNLGAINGMLGLLEAAGAAFNRAVTLCSDEPRAHFNLARLCTMQQRLDEAATHWFNYLRLKPGDADGYLELGKILHTLKRLPEAESALHEALQRNPANANYYNHAALVLHDLRRYDEAVELFQQGLQLNPRMVELHCNLGNLYHDRGDDVLARACYEKVLAIDPENASAHMNLGMVEARAGHHDAATRYFKEALRLQPNYAGAHWNLALLLLALGQFRDGWQEYEWRFYCDEIKRREILARYSSKPAWSGEPLMGQRLLVYVEQGFGDTLQFCRYLPLVRQRVEKMIFECQPELLPLLQNSIEGVELIPRPADGALPALNYDVQIPLMSLPRLFETELESVPRRVPYIQADPQQVELWRQRLVDDGFKVGLVWAGNPGHWRDQLRSMALTSLAPLGEIAGVSFYSLQKGVAAAEAATPPAGLTLIDLAPQLDDFATTAAVIANLDLVISVDTSVAHLAGALGKEVWTLIYSPPDWRWLYDREESPWYPTMRLFRQRVSGEWGEVVERLVEELGKVVSNRDLSNH